MPRRGRSRPAATPRRIKPRPARSHGELDDRPNLATPKPHPTKPTTPRHINPHHAATTRSTTAPTSPRRAPSPGWNCRLAAPAGRPGRSSARLNFAISPRQALDLGGPAVRRRCVTSNRSPRSHTQLDDPSSPAGRSRRSAALPLKAEPLSQAGPDNPLLRHVKGPTSGNRRAAAAHHTRPGEFAMGVGMPSGGRVDAKAGPGARGMESSRDPRHPSGSAARRLGDSATRPSGCPTARPALTPLATTGSPDGAAPRTPGPRPHHPRHNGRLNSLAVGLREGGRCRWRGR
jgi:hypothetical protein